MFLDSIVRLIIGLLWKDAPGFVVPLLARLLPELWEIVEDLIEDKALDALETAKEIEGALDEALDVLPGWRELSEERRDMVLGGLHELFVFLYTAFKKDDGKATRRDVNDVVRGLRRRARRASRE